MDFTNLLESGDIWGLRPSTMWNKPYMNLNGAMMELKSSTWETTILRGTNDSSQVVQGTHQWCQWNQGIGTSRSILWNIRVGINRGIPTPSQSNDISLTRVVREKTERCEAIYELTHWIAGEGREGKELNRGRGEWETQTSSVQSMMAGQTRQQMKLNSWKWNHSCNTENIAAYGE